VPQKHDPVQLSDLSEVSNRAIDLKPRDAGAPILKSEVSKTADAIQRVCLIDLIICLIDLIICFKMMS
jgi:hypothetical protein